MSLSSKNSQLRIAERPPHPRSLRSLDLSPHAGRGAGKHPRSRDACASEFCCTARTKASRPNKRGGGAPVGAPWYPLRTAGVAACFRGFAARAVLFFPSACAGGSARGRARLAALHRGSRRGFYPSAQSGLALHGRGQPIRAPGSQLLADPPIPVRLGGGPGEFPNRPNAVCETAPGHRTRSTFRIASGKRPSKSELMVF